ncbi:MAG: ECF transporter S component [Ruminococcaceae bacterium]|nr:ECF transporter S component [Oscillospiraceae bacterium]
MKKHNRLLNMILASLFLALAYVLPFLTGQIPKIGSVLCPMHPPVLLCGFICGWPWGLIVGFIAPLLRSALTGGFPPMFPTAVCMAFELAAYGAIAGLMHKILPRKKPFIYCSLITAMILGRLVWGAAMFICVGLNSGSFTFAAFIAGALTNAVPGIILQIVLVPVIVMLLDNLNVLKLRDQNGQK